MKGAIEKAKELVGTTPHAFMPDQFANPANPRAHYRTTGPEIWEATQGKVDLFVAGVGTGGTLTGVSRALKEKNPDLLSVAVEPSASQVIAGKPAGPHRIQGIGAGFIPANLDLGMVDQTLAVDGADAITAARNLALDHGILCGISSGAAFWAACRTARDHPGKTIVFMVCDTGERYLSTDLFAL
jgi:cysteine synthase A